MQEVDPRDIANAALEFVLATRLNKSPETVGVFKNELKEAINAYKNVGGTSEDINNLLVEGASVAANLKLTTTEASV